MEVPVADMLEETLGVLVSLVVAEWEELWLGLLVWLVLKLGGAEALGVAVLQADKEPERVALAEAELECEGLVLTDAESGADWEGDALAQEVEEGDCVEFADVEGEPVAEAVCEEDRDTDTEEVWVSAAEVDPLGDGDREELADMVLLPLKLGLFVWETEASAEGETLTESVHV